MKTFSIIIALCLFSLLFSCKPDDTMDIPFPSCMIAKINQYQLKNQKLKLVEIDQDGTKYYWLKNESFADEIENVYDAISFALLTANVNQLAIIVIRLYLIGQRK